MPVEQLGNGWAVDATRGKSNGQNYPMTWPAEEQEVVYRNKEYMVDDKKLAPKLGSKPFFAFIGEHFESVEELKHLKEVLLDLFRGEVCHFYKYKLIFRTEIIS